VKCTTADHDAIKADPVQWRALPLVGHQDPFDDERPNYILECRNCTRCHSTLMIEVTRQPKGATAMKMIAVLTFLTVAACVDNTTNNVTSKPVPSMEWIVFTHSTCNGKRVDDSIKLCGYADAHDTLITGDHAAQSYAQLWIGSCLATQGNIGTPDEDRLCLDTAGNAAPFGCDASFEIVGACP
jgi:hypothetical protein